MPGYARSRAGFCPNQKVKSHLGSWCPTSLLDVLDKIYEGK